MYFHFKKIYVFQCLLKRYRNKYLLNEFKINNKFQECDSGISKK